MALGVLLAVAGGFSSKAWAQTRAHYRFEEGQGTGVVDSVSGTVHGQLQPGSTFSADTPKVGSR